LEFATKHRDIRCNYSNFGKIPGNQENGLFIKHNLTLFLTDRELHNERELLCVHSDPNNADPIPMRQFKKGPHLHIKHREEILCHAHFPMTIGYIDKAVHSVQELTRIYEEIVSLLSIEVVKRFQDVN